MSEWISEVSGHTPSENVQVGLGGHTDWRLPTIVELQTIVDCAHPACLDPAFSPRLASFYWSSSTSASLPDSAWFVSFFSGFAGDFVFKGNAFRVRAVRGGP